VSHRPGGTEATDQEPQKNFWSFMPYNLLISLVSDERIQGNPIADNGVFAANGRRAKKIQTYRLEPNRTVPNCPNRSSTAEQR
jgi:hypothetical protein